MLSFGCEKKEGTYRRIDESRPTSTTTSVSDEYPIAELLSAASLKKKTKEKKKVCSAARSRLRWWRRHANDLETRLDRSDHVFNTRESDNDYENVPSRRAVETGE